MGKMIAICGLDCSVCPAYIAFRTDDQALREKTAAEWSKTYHIDVAAADINCAGCVIREGAHIGHCYECEFRKCGLAKNVTNCGVCPDFPCAAIGPFLEKVPAAKANLDEVRAKP